jgi:glycosyltransferase involved in cell wall biosynthesis
VAVSSCDGHQEDCVNILSITAGAAEMYCGSCLRDNALAAALLARGHQVTLLPIYTPTITDEPNISSGRRVFLGGISVYLQQHLALFRHTPWFLDRLWDAPAVIKRFAARSVTVDPRMLGALTVSTLRGEKGHQRKEIDKLVAFLADEPPPDVVNLPNSMLIGLAAPLRRALGRPIVVTLQGEDLFLNGLPDPFREEALALIRRQVNDVDLFVSVSEYYAGFMSEYLDIPRERIRTVPLGVNVADLQPAARPRPPARPFTIGYFARIAPEKGLQNLAEAYCLLRTRHGLPAARLVAAGYLANADRQYLDRVQRTIAEAGLAAEFEYKGVVDRAGKIRFLQELDLLSVPSPYQEPKGLYLLEAMACGVPVVQPNHGAFPEMIGKTGGGVLADSDRPAHVADAIHALWRAPEQAAALSERGALGVRAHYTIEQMADRMVSVYRELLETRAASDSPHQAISVARR